MSDANPQLTFRIVPIAVGMQCTYFALLAISPRYRRAEGLLALREGGIVERVRHKVAYEGSCWEIDVFSGENEGLVVAEIELSDTQQTFKRPPWLGDEVTGDLRFYNASLAQKPFRVW